MDTVMVAIDADVSWDGEDDTLTVAIIAPADWDTADLIDAMLHLVECMQEAELEMTAANDTAH